MMNYQQYIRHQDVTGKYSHLELDHEFLNEYRSRWISYSTSKPIPDEFNQKRLALTEQVLIKSLEGYKLYHLTLTYRPYQDRQYGVADMNKFFCNFYLKGFLPHLLNSRNIQSNTKRGLQPFTYAFLDEHEPKPMKSWKLGANGRTQETTHFAARLHHHVIIAAHPETDLRMKAMVGLNTFSSIKFSNLFMTTDLRECEAQTLLYAAKLLHRYPDFLSFPDRLSSTSNF